MSTDPTSTTTRRKNRREEIEKLFALRKREHLTWGQLSARCDIPVGTLTTWQQKLRKEAETGGFVELTPSPAPDPAAEFRLETATGLRIHVPARFDPELFTLFDVVVVRPDVPGVVRW